jgi:2-(1,2-epoxy-1,2-dihydrophenyl)acetyl-CoA isomerase
MEHVLLDRRDAVATVTLNRPERRNAMDVPMWRQLLAALHELAGDSEVRVVILTGAGGAFCSGADLSGLPEEANDPFLMMMRLVGDVAVRLHRMPKPTIAKVDGAAVGAGCNMALACDLVVASEGARFSEIFSQRGLSLDFGGSWLLPRLVGLARAKELAFFGDFLSAGEARDVGLVNRVVPADRLDDEVAAWADRLAAGPAIALSLTKALLDDGLSRSFEASVEAEAAAQSLNVTTSDAVEARRAFAERRAPRFGTPRAGRGPVAPSV